MRTLFAAGMLLVSVSAWAISQEDFGSFFRKSTAMTDFVITSKKACICHGGTLNGRAGIAVLAFGAPGEYAYVECVHPRWATDGQERDEAGCVDAGGSAEVLSK